MEIVRRCGKIEGEESKVRNDRRCSGIEGDDSIGTMGKSKFRDSGMSARKFGEWREARESLEIREMGERRFAVE